MTQMQGDEGTNGIQKNENDENDDEELGDRRGQKFKK